MTSSAALELFEDAALDCRKLGVIHPPQPATVVHRVISLTCVII